MEVVVPIKCRHCSTDLGTKTFDHQPSAEEVAVLADLYVCDRPGCLAEQADAHHDPSTEKHR